MKKIFTFVLAAMAAMTMFAKTATVTVWEGEMTTPDWSEKHDAEATVLGMIDGGQLKAGDVLKFYGYRTDSFEEGQYCSIAVINGSWTSLIDGSTGDDRTVLHFNDSAKWVAQELDMDEFEITEETLPLFSGFIVSGHGFTLTKIELNYEMEQRVLFEGEMLTPDWSEKHDAEAAALAAIESGALAAGSEITVYGYRTDSFEEGQYCSIAVINGSWTSLIDGSTGDDRTVLHFNDSAKWVARELDQDSFEVTEETLPLFSGFIISGHGFTLTKIEVSVYRVNEKPAVEDLETSVVLWTAEAGWMDEEEPSNMIDGWGDAVVALTDPAFVSLFAQTYTRVANMYVRLVDVEGEPLKDEGQNFRIAGNWGDWAETAFPKDGYNHLMNMDEDGVVKVALTEEFIDKTINSEDAGFVLWGAGYFFVWAVGTTKEAVMNAEPMAIQNVELLQNGIRYNIMGQKVSEDYKGIVILNGKKMLQ